MDINRENYEAWLLDLLEGRLSVEQAQKLRDFFLLHPECDTGLDELDTWVLEVDPVPYPGKPDLKKVLPGPDSQISEKHFDLFSIARLERDLNDRQENEYRSLIERDKRKKADWLAWQKTKLVGEDISYRGKKALKKRAAPRSVVMWISIAAAAAVVVLFFTLFRFDRAYVLPGEKLTQEAEMDPGSGETNEIPEIDQQPDIFLKDSSGSPVLLADEPVSLSIKKHQDPPELTGIKRDTLGQKVRQEELKARPVKLSMMDRNFMKQAERGSYDRIEPFNIPPINVYSEPSAFEKFSEQGLRASYRDFIKERDISLLTIASAGIEGINNLSGSDMKLNVSRDEDGAVTGFRFKSSLLSVDSPVKKKNKRGSVQPDGR